MVSRVPEKFTTFCTSKEKKLISSTGIFKKAWTISLGKLASIMAESTHQSWHTCGPSDIDPQRSRKPFSENETTNGLWFPLLLLLLWVIKFASFNLWTFVLVKAFMFSLSTNPKSFFSRSGRVGKFLMKSTNLKTRTHSSTHSLILLIFAFSPLSLSLFPGKPRKVQSPINTNQAPSFVEVWLFAEKVSANHWMCFFSGPTGPNTQPL